MKPKRTLIVAAASILAVLVGLVVTNAQNTPNAAATAVAVVDFPKIKKELREKLKIDGENKTQQVKLQQEEEGRNEAIRQLEKDLKDLSPGSQAHQEAERKWIKASIEKQSWSAFELRMFNLDALRREDTLNKKAIDAIERVARENGFGVVLFKQQTQSLGTNQQGQPITLTVSIVAWNSEATDLTDPVIQRMNNEFLATP